MSSTKQEGGLGFWVQVGGVEGRIRDLSARGGETKKHPYDSWNKKKTGTRTRKRPVIRTRKRPVLEQEKDR